VIEAVMIFALGFLAASLCGLLLLPALNARAARLARRRAEARLPLSPAEIAAERDFLRAQFAVQQRRLERRVETAEAKRQADMAAIGAGTMRVAALTRDVAARESDIALAQAKTRELETELAVAREDGTASLATLQALEEAHADLLDSLLAMRQGARAPDVGADAATLAAERDDLRASLRAAEEALALTLADRQADRTEERSAGHHAGIERENADLRRRIAEVADALTSPGRMPRAAYPVPQPERV
jgi:chromosome segregation ATPase